MKRSCTPVPRFEVDSYDWNERHQFCQERAIREHADVIFIGDSITHFWEDKHGGPVWEKYFKGKSVMNIGYGWDRTPNVLWRLDHGEFANQSPKLLVLNIGTNNFAKTVAYPGDEPEDVADGICAVIAKIHELSPSTHILDMAVFPRIEPSHCDKVPVLNRILKERLAGVDYVTFLDITASFMNPDGTRNNAYFRDGAHLTNEGYEVWADALRPYLKRFADMDI